ncbi:site-specific integrase [Pseudoalteromonas sp. Z1A8]|uniref:site-specific integrase n=1 Tax=Pseudoalteromonas sp. Z1A8 TaxID=2686354 RepID=UPI0014079EE1|nr:site-specific integrase [Pseudoalteromonas sp. Z1A8]
MSEKLIHQHTKQISDYLTQFWSLKTTEDDISWVLTYWQITEKKTRIVDNTVLRKITQQINAIPSGKQRAYKQALEGILFYLGEACHWQLPELIKNTISDTNHQYFEELAKGAAHAHKIFACYQQQKTYFFDTREPLTPCFMALIIGFEVAPLSLEHISAILNNPNSIIDKEDNPRLAITHMGYGTDELRATHYYLSIESYRFLEDYYAQSPPRISSKCLYVDLSSWVEKNGLPACSIKQTWPKRFQISWYLRFQLPPIFIKDLANPERHVGLSKPISLPKIKEAGIYAIDWDTKWFDSLTKLQKKVRWPHEALLKHSKDFSTVETPPWDANNILPRLLFDYTKQLLVYGGVKKASLALGSIKNYTSLKSKLEPYPLCYADAISEEAINGWAQTVYDSIDSDIVKGTFYNFLRFLSYQEQTDTLDLSSFSSPLVAPSVSPGRLTVDEFDRLLEVLLSSKTNNPFRSLFGAIAALLGFYAMLRRGEVLRLRRKDIRFKPSNGLITITVTNTPEGNTKSNTTRTVYTTLPVQYRQLFIYLFEIKKNIPREQPLLGFEGEKYHSRQLYYLLPVSRALRCLFGKHLNFHHLRHSGVHLFMLQTLYFVSVTPDEQRGKTPLEQEVLSNNSVTTRFDYWFEGRAVHEVNDAAFLDEMGLQIGHIYYDTTRWSYLHDIEWLLPIISRAHAPYVLHEHTHSELRYLLRLSPKSNDLSRILLRLSPEYANKTLGQKRSQPVKLSDKQLREVVLGKKNEAEKTSTTVDLALMWKKSIHSSEHSLLSFIFEAMFEHKALDLSALSFIWDNGSKHHIKPISKKQRTALNNLPPILLSDDEQSLQISLACNSKNARAFTTVFRHTDWDWLSIAFTLSVNQKINGERQVVLLKTLFSKKDEAIQIAKHAKGESLLTINLTPKTTLSSKTLKFAKEFIQLFQCNKVKS